MPVAADSPPMNTNKASADCPAASGSDMTKFSAPLALPKCNRPPTAMGNTNRLISSK